MPVQDSFLVRTEHGEVVVRINPECRNALQNDLLLLSVPSEEEKQEFQMLTPLRAFGAKMVDIIQGVGTGDFDPGPRLRDMMIKEKATSDLKRIERWAKENL